MDCYKEEIKKITEMLGRMVPSVASKRLRLIKKYPGETEKIVEWLKTKTFHDTSDEIWRLVEEYSGEEPNGEYMKELLAIADEVLERRGYCQLCAKWRLTSTCTPGIVRIQCARDVRRRMGFFGKLIRSGRRCREFPMRPNMQVCDTYCEEFVRGT